MAKVGVLLSGCGVNDGAEIHEAVCTMLALDKAGAEYICMAPDIKQRRVYDHQADKEASDETRNVLTEAARIARGNIKNLSQVKAADIDALIIPGGFGSALNLSDFALKGAECTVEAEVKRIVGEMLDAGKPIGALCISPPIIAAVMRDRDKPGVQVTIGNDKATAEAVEKMGAKHQDRPSTEVTIDETNKVVTTPAYMLAQRISEIYEGADKVVREVIRLI